MPLFSARRVSSPPLLVSSYWKPGASPLIATLSNAPVTAPAPSRKVNRSPCLGA